MVGKIIATVGISGSGKSTWIKEQVNKDAKNSVIVNRDKIRELIYGYTEETIKDYFNTDTLLKTEKEVSFYEDTLIRTALRQGKTVYVDNTHLREKYIKKLEVYSCEIEFIVFNVPLDICLERDFNRNRKVGAKIILEQFEKFKNVKNYILKEFIEVGKHLDEEYSIYINPSPTITKITQNKYLPKAIIVDIDGTLATKGDRSIYDLSKVHLDTVNNHVKDIVNNYFDSGVEVFVFTGREAVAEEATRKWLNDNNVKFHHLHCRAEGDFRKDSIVKKELFEKYIEDEYYIQCVLDDRMQVIRMWNDLGLPVLSNNPLAIEF